MLFLSLKFDDRQRRRAFKRSVIPPLLMLTFLLPGIFVPVWSGGTVAFGETARGNMDAAPSVGTLDMRIGRATHLVDLLEYARMKNPELAATRASWRAFIQARRLGTAYPDPQLSTLVFPRPIETRLGPQDWSLNLNQPIPFPGLLDQKGRVLESDVILARLKQSRILKEVVTRITVSFHELAYLSRALELARENLALREQAQEILLDAYGRDQSLFMEVSLVSIAIAKLETRISRLEEKITAEKIRLNGLLNRKSDAPFGPLEMTASLPLPLSQTLEEVQALGIAHGEWVRMAEEGIKKAEAMVALARLENMPNFSLGLFYAAIGEPDTPTRPEDAGRDALGIKFGVSFPLWSGKRQSRVARAKADKARFQAIRDQKINEVNTRISRIWFSLSHSRRDFERHKDEILPRTLQAMETAEIRFRQGKGRLQDLLTLQTAVHDFQLAMARARTDHAQQQAELEQWAGVVLDLPEMKGKPMGPKGMESEKTGSTPMDRGVMSREVMNRDTANPGRNKA